MWEEGGGDWLGGSKRSLLHPNRHPAHPELDLQQPQHQCSTTALSRFKDHRDRDYPLPSFPASNEAPGPVRLERNTLMFQVVKFPGLVQYS